MPLQQSHRNKANAKKPFSYAQRPFHPQAKPAPTGKYAKMILPWRKLGSFAPVLRQILRLVKHFSSGVTHPSQKRGLRCIFACLIIRIATNPNSDPWSGCSQNAIPLHAEI